MCPDTRSPKAGASGGGCPPISPSGKVSLMTCAPGNARGDGCAYPRRYAHASEHKRRSPTIPRRGGSRARRSKPPRWEGRSADVTTARQCMAASATSLEIPAACSASLWSQRPLGPIKLGHATSASGGVAPGRNGAKCGWMGRSVGRHGPPG
jgi:hypothetical protein